MSGRRNRSIKQRRTGRKRRAQHNRRGGDMERTRGGIMTNRSLNRRSVVHVPRGVQIFPDDYICWGVTDTQVGISGLVGNSYTFKLNAPFNLFGPQVGYTGAFAVNVPAGSNAILGSNTFAGSTQPYNKCVVLSQEFEITVLTNNAGVANTAPFSVIAFPSLAISASGLPNSVFREQPNAVYSLGPAVMTEPLRITGKFDMHTLFGVSQTELLNDPAYEHQPGVDPTQIMYHQIFVQELTGAVNLSVYVQFRYVTKYLFRKRNNLNSTAPS